MRTCTKLGCYCGNLRSIIFRLRRRMPRQAQMESIAGRGVASGRRQRSRRHRRRGEADRIGAQVSAETSGR